MAENSISSIPVEIFAKYIVEKLHKSNPHLVYATDESSFVMGGAVVHIPQAGNSPSVTKNRKVFPAVAVQRGDSYVTYTLDVYTTDPTHVTWHEENEISYAKTDSVLSDHVETLVEAVGDNMVYNWVHGLVLENGAYVSSVLPVANRIFTSGELTAVNPEDGQEGTRRAFVHGDLSKAQSMMNKMNVPKDGRYAMIESYMYQQLVDSLTSNQMAAFQAGADIKNGVVGKLYGFNIIERSSVLSIAADGTINLPGQALEATDNIAALCWQQGSVAKAKGDLKPFQNVDDATYYGDIFSALVKFGGRCRRADWKGVLAIVQTPSV